MCPPHGFPFSRGVPDFVFAAVSGPEPVPKPEPEPVQPVELTPPETPPVEKKITHHDEIILLPNADGSVGAVVVRQHGVEKMLAELTRRRAAEISVIGHTDTFGSIQFNDKLSLQRARRVRQLLIARGFRRTASRSSVAANGNS